MSIVAIPLAQQKQIIATAARRHGIDPAILWGLYGTETSFGHDVTTSSTGAIGPFQFESGTARSLGIDPNDFAQAADGAARYLAQYASRGTAGMLSAYNAGPAGGLQPGYVASVLKNAASWTKAPTPTTTTSGARTTSTKTSGGSSGHGSTALHALLTVALAGAGAVMGYLGIARSIGVEHPIRTPARAARAATLAGAAA